MRQLIHVDKSGHIIGEFPHDRLAGFQNSRRGLRKRLMNAKEAATMDMELALQIAQDRYDLKEKELRETQFVENEKKRQEEYRRKNISVSDAVKVWKKHIEVTTVPKTVKAYMNTMNLYLNHVGDHKLSEFSLSHNIQFTEVLQNQPSTKHPGQCFSVSTQHMHLRQLQNFLNWAKDNEYTEKVHRLKKPTIPEKDIDVFSIQHLQTLKAHLYKNLNESDQGRPEVNARNLIRAFTLATKSLMRIGAIAHLPLEAIDLTDRIIRIRDVPERGWKNKGSKWPNKPISPSLYEYLKGDLASRGEHERWFLDDGTGKPWFAWQDNISRMMTKQIKAAGLPAGVKPFHWAMRGTMITWLLNDGEDPQKVQQLADHSDYQTTKGYYNTREANQKSAVERLPDI